MKDDSEKLAARFLMLGIDEEQSKEAVEAMRHAIALCAMMLKCNPDSPNFLTMTIDWPGSEDTYAFTLQRCSGMTPAHKIEALEKENIRLRQRLRIAESGS